MVQVLIKPSGTNEWICGALLHVWEWRIKQVHIAGRVQTCYPLAITGTVSCYEQWPVMGMLENSPPLFKYHSLPISVIWASEGLADRGKEGPQGMLSISQGM